MADWQEAIVYTPYPSCRKSTRPSALRRGRSKATVQEDSAMSTSPAEDGSRPRRRSWLRRALSLILMPIAEPTEAWMLRTLVPEAGPPATDQVRAWRDGFWGGFALASRSNEPARRLLPKREDRWRPATWRHFRFELIRHLQTEGAHSLRELDQDPPEVLGLKLNHQELRAIVDSARRRDEVQALPQAGGPARETAWIVTEKGEKATSHWLPWLFSQGSTLRVWVAPVATTLSVFGIGASQVDEPSLWSLAVFSVLIGLAVWIGASIRAVTNGSKPGRQVGRDWYRWGEERPNGYRQLFRPFPWRRTTVGIAVAIPGMWAFPTNQNLGFALSAVGILCLFPALLWMGRWGPLEAPSTSRQLEWQRNRTSDPS